MEDKQSRINELKTLITEVSCTGRADYALESEYKELTGHYLSDEQEPATPSYDKVKKGVKCCTSFECSTCPYKGKEKCTTVLDADFDEMIAQLENGVEE